MFGFGVFNNPSRIFRSVELKKNPPLDQAQDDYNKVQNTSPNEASLGHEIIAGGASFMAMKEFEDHQRSKGKPPTPTSYPLI